MGKTECRPHLVDWNRDGYDDIVVAMNLDSSDYESFEPVYKYGVKLLINTNSADRKHQLKLGQAANAKRAKDEPFKDNEFGRPQTGPHMEVKLRALDSEVAQRDIEFDFADLDSDGNFDIVYFENVWDEKVDKENNGYSRKYASSKIYWRRNTTSKGEPKFSKPKPLFDSKTIIRSIAVVDFDGDGRKEVAICSEQKVRLLVQE